MKHIVLLLLVLSALDCCAQPFLVSLDMCRNHSIDSVRISEVAYNHLDTILDKVYKYERATDRLFWALPSESNERQWMELSTDQGKKWMDRLKKQFTPLSQLIPSTVFEQIHSTDSIVVERDSTQRILSILSYDTKSRGDRLLHAYSYGSSAVSDSSFVVTSNRSRNWIATSLYIIGSKNRTICMIGTSADNTITEEYHVFYSETGLPVLVRYVKDGVIVYDHVYQYHFC